MEIPPKDKVPTLADVAREAGVSTATVSRCLNAPDRVGKTTREKVLATVQTLGYAPNFSAQALAAKRTNTIGAVIPTMENAIFARGIQAFQEELGRHGMTLLIASSAYEEALEAEQIRTLVARGADALLLIGFHRSPEIYAFLKKRKIPALVAWAFDEHQTEPAIGFDNTEAMAELARLALRYGHEHIGMISAETEANDRARGRLEGVRKALEEAGIPPNQMSLETTQYGIECGEAAFRRIVSIAPETSLVICGNDVLAIGAMRAAKEMGLHIPQDISITGFDDIELAMLAEPGLTTVHVPHRKMGRRAAHMLMRMVKYNEPMTSIKLETDIRLRGSLGPKPARASVEK